MSNDINIMAIYQNISITIDSNIGYQNIDIGCQKKSTVSQLWRFLGQPIEQRQSDLRLQGLSCLVKPELHRILEAQNMGVSENVGNTPKPNGFADHYISLRKMASYHWEY